MSYSIISSNIAIIDKPHNLSWLPFPIGHKPTSLCIDTATIRNSSSVRISYFSFLFFNSLASRTLVLQKLTATGTFVPFTDLSGKYPHQGPILIRNLPSPVLSLLALAEKNLHLSLTSKVQGAAFSLLDKQRAQFKLPATHARNIRYAYYSQIWIENTLKFLKLFESCL